MKLPIYFGWIFMAICAIIVVVCYFVFGKERNRKETQDDFMGEFAAAETAEEMANEELLGQTMVAAPGFLAQTEEAQQEDAQKTAVPEEILEQTMIIPQKESEDHLELNPLEYTIVAGSIGDEEVLAKIQHEEEAAGEEAEKVAEIAPQIEENELEDASLSENRADTKEDSGLEGLSALPVWERLQQVEANIAEEEVETAAQENIDRSNLPIPFGSKICWLAIKNNSLKKVAQALNVQDVETITWEKGFPEAYKNEGQLFVTPPINGWILVIGRSLLDKIGIYDVEDDFNWLLDLSEDLGIVQYFCTQSTVNYHAWAWCEKGKLVRAYAYSGKAGECLWDLGDPGQEEEVLMLGKRALSESGRFVPDESFVLALAAAWSVDPSFQNITYDPAPGMLGFLETE